ncbi:N-formylglutamate amidohydrolase [Fodinicurvata sp. EGI_FJ10296]|uniref:N-formylglutamate amidohydrolase n=1 Tax=Fodinicurvata sp. EGI_FJ10296 TaxID=3231908 RepID=UPI00345739F4
MRASDENSVNITETPAPEAEHGLAAHLAAAGPPRPDGLGVADPDVYDVVNPGGRRPVLLLADHAGRAIPDGLGKLGLPESELARHIAYDPGVDAITRHMALALDAPAIIHRYSRLLIDPNRPLNDPTSICQISDGTIVPGNRALSMADRQARARTFFEPYHRAVAAAIDWMKGRTGPPAVVSVHSFSPVVRGRRRPWEIGVLWGDDARLPVPFMEKMRAEGLCVGDNEPYSGRNLHGYTMETHVLPFGYANILLELRQDEVADAASQDLWATRLEAALRPILEDLNKNG